MDFCGWTDSAAKFQTGTDGSFKITETQSYNCHLALEPYLPTSDCQCPQGFAGIWKESAELSRRIPAFLLYEFEPW